MKPPPSKDKKPDELAVFIPQRDAKCDECGDEIEEFLFKEKERAFCLECADMDHLVYLRRGDVALTRRSRKYSKLSAVVLEWSRRRKQYERQGILVEEDALYKAEIECVMDAEKREHNRKRAAVRTEQAESVYLKDFTAKIIELYPGCPAEAADAVARHACTKYSGRVGRSAAAKEFSQKAIRLAVQAHIRHCYTDYDERLSQGQDRHEAREEVFPVVDKIVEQWTRQLATK